MLGREGQHPRCMRKLAPARGAVPFFAAACLVTLGAVAGGSTAASAQQPSVWVTMINPEVRYVSWQTRQPDAFNPTPSKGTQVYVPFGGQINFQPNDEWAFEFVARSGYVATRHTITENNLNKLYGAIDTFTDSSVALTTTYKGFSWMQPYVSLALNLPTGKTRLDNDQQRALIDSDIVQVPAYGQGLNIAPTVGVNVPLGSTALLNFAVGYTDRGKYERMFAGGWGGQPITVSPGEILTFTVGYGYYDGPISFSTSVSWSHETTTRWTSPTKDFDYFRSGDTVNAFAALGYAWNSNFTTRMSALYSYTWSNHTDFVPPATTDHTFVLEDANSNSTMIRATFEAVYAVGALTLTPSVTYMHRDHNAWSNTDNRFIPAKEAWTVGMAAQYNLAEQIAINGRVERTWLHVSSTLLNFPPVPTLDSDVWLVTLGVIVRI